MPSTDASLLASVDARTKLAGSNKMEILLFSLGTRETFGINVFKVREVSQTPAITKTPNMPFGVEGVLSLRGNIIPVISLAKFIGHDHNESKFDTMIVTEFNKSTQAFLVDSVDRIIRVDWDKVRAPENIMAALAKSMRAAAGRRKVFIVAENENQNTSLVRPPEQGGCGLDGLWNDDFHHTARVAVTGRNEAYYTDFLGRPQ